MPPRGFIVEFANYYAQCHKVVRALDSLTVVNEDGVRQAIRIILSCIAQLARRFDAAQQYTYAANIMQYWESAQAWQVATGSGAMPDVKFAEVEAAVDRLPLLILDQTLSTTTGLENLNFSPDPALEKMKHMALPIPAKGHAGKSDDGRRWRVLPGAPLAFFTETSISYAHANELGKWCRERGDFSESVALQVDAHFGQADLQSFASIPIKSSINGKPFGVVNLHSTGPGMLSGAGVPSQFFPLTEPFINLLADSLTRLSKIRQAS